MTPPRSEEEESRITAFLLDQVEAEERIAIEKRLATDASLALLAERINSTIGMLEESFPSPSRSRLPAFPETRRRAILARLAVRTRPGIPWYAPLALAACLILSLSFALMHTMLETRTGSDRSPELSLATDRKPLTRASGSAPRPTERASALRAQEKEIRDVFEEAAGDSIIPDMSPGFHGGESGPPETPAPPVTGPGRENLRQPSSGPDLAGKSLGGRVRTRRLDERRENLHFGRSTNQATRAERESDRERVPALEESGEGTTWERHAGGYGRETIRARRQVRMGGTEPEDPEEAGVPPTSLMSNLEAGDSMGSGFAPDGGASAVAASDSPDFHAGKDIMAGSGITVAKAPELRSGREPAGADGGMLGGAGWGGFRLDAKEDAGRGVALHDEAPVSSIDGERDLAQVIHESGPQLHPEIVPLQENNAALTLDALESRDDGSMSRRIPEGVVFEDLAEVSGGTLYFRERIAAVDESAASPQDHRLLPGEVRDGSETQGRFVSRYGIVDAEQDLLRWPVPQDSLDRLPGEPGASAAFEREAITRDRPVSTFSLNVGDASFHLAGASLENGIWPEKTAIRPEEFFNAFTYRDPLPAQEVPVALRAERARFPFGHGQEILRIGIRTRFTGRSRQTPLNLVLLLDGSGSMERLDRQAIVQQALGSLAGSLEEQDRISIVRFARQARVWGERIPARQARGELERIRTLVPEGGTNLEEALVLAYDTARKHFLPQGLNRVVLLTDGAANLGNTDNESLQSLVEENRRQGIALDCFGIGWDGFDDHRLESLTRNSDGHYAFLDRPEEVEREFRNRLLGALDPAAGNLKVRIRFNPDRILRHRQIGHARHQLREEEFRDDTVDAAEIAQASTGTALYVLTPDPQGRGEVGTLSVRYEDPQDGRVREISRVLRWEGEAPDLAQASPSLRLATASGILAEWLGGIPYSRGVEPDDLLALVTRSRRDYPLDPGVARLESMLRTAMSLHHSGKAP